MCLLAILEPSDVEIMIRLCLRTFIDENFAVPEQIRRMITYGQGFDQNYDLFVPMDPYERDLRSDQSIFTRYDHYLFPQFLVHLRLKL